MLSGRHIAFVLVGHQFGVFYATFWPRQGDKRQCSRTVSSPLVLPRWFGVSRLGSQDKRQLWELKRDPCDLCMYVILLYQSGGSHCHQQSTLIFHIPLTFLTFSSLPPLFLNMLVLSVFLLHMFPFGPGKRFN